jgi:hypothetical protein
VQHWASSSSTPITVPPASTHSDLSSTLIKSLSSQTTNISSTSSSKSSVSSKVSAVEEKTAIASAHGVSSTIISTATVASQLQSRSQSQRVLPAVRKGATIRVNFTARAGPTPAREDFDAAQAAAHVILHYITLVTLSPFHLIPLSCHYPNQS